jgi:hypothetical protein
MSNIQQNNNKNKDKSAELEEERMDSEGNSNPETKKEVINQQRKEEHLGHKIIPSKEKNLSERFSSRLK